MPPKQKPPQPKRYAAVVDWPEKEGWKPFGHRLGGLSLTNRGFLTGVHQIQPKQPRGQ